MTEARKIQPDVARVVVGEDASTPQKRVVNLTEETVKLKKDKSLGGLHPVQVQPRKSTKETRGSEGVPSKRGVDE